MRSERPRSVTARRARLLRFQLSVLLALFYASQLAFAALVPHPLRSAIVVKSVAYERGFSERRGDAVLAVVAGSAGPSADDGRSMAALFKKLVAENRVAGRKLTVAHVVHESNEATFDALARQRAEIVYLASGLENLAAAIPMHQDSIRRIVVCADGARVESGCALGVELNKETPRIVLNMKRANAAGLRFDPGLLRLARTTR